MSTETAIANRNTATGVIIPFNSDDIKNREDFLKNLNSAPEKVDKAQGYDTVPISSLEMELDQTYLGLWQTDNFRFQIVANEIVGVLDLHVFDPNIKTWLTRSGSASVMIRQKSGADITDISAKIKNGLGMDFPKLQTMCLKAAAKTLGKRFGRELNRKFEDDYEAIYTNEAEIDGVREILQSQLKECRTKENLMSVWNNYTEYHQNPQLLKIFNAAKTRLGYANTNK